MGKSALLLAFLIVLTVCGGAFAAGSVLQQTPNISAFDHYLTVADVEKVSGLMEVTRTSGMSPGNMGPQYVFHTSDQRKIVTLQFTGAQKYADYRKKCNVALSGLGDQAAQGTTVPNYPPNLIVFAKGTIYAAITVAADQSTSSGGKKLNMLTIDQAKTLAEIIVMRIN